MSIRILHIADIHLGVEAYGRIDPATGLNTRLADFTRCLDMAVDRAIHDDVEVFLFAGDAYRTRDPNPTLQREFALRVRRLADAGIVVFLLAGNHDLPNAFGRAAALEIFSALAIPQVHVARKAGPCVLETRRGPLQIMALPWVTRSQFLAADEWKGRPEDEVNQAIADQIGDFITKRAGELNPDIPTVFTAHIGVMGAQSGSERVRVLGNDVVVPRSLLSHPAFDYVALGHIHRRQVLQDYEPPVIYSGSIERVDFSEEHEPKGFVLAQVDRGRCRHELVDVPARRFVTIEVNASGEEPLHHVMRAIERQPVADAIVRLVVKTGPENEAQLPLGELRRALKEAHYATVSLEVERERRMRFTGEFPEAMSPHKALERYLQFRQTPPERAQRLLEYGDRLAATLKPEA
ncbi:MAG: exonuclease SbcCD subunit D [Bacteroidetes bacterium]|nr:exonuclease SbcCD subunit D [Bacteroidota bacterium]